MAEEFFSNYYPIMSAHIAGSAVSDQAMTWSPRQPAGNVGVAHLNATKFGSNTSIIVCSNIGLESTWNITTTPIDTPT